MSAWPQISEPELLERLALTDDGFRAYMARYVDGLGRREYSASLYEHALGYPWERPRGSYLLTDDAVEPLADMDAPRRDDVQRAMAREDERIALLAYGSNGAPRQLAAKFAHFSEADDRRVLVLAGALHDFDVGVAAHPTGYGAMPATIFASPGTAVRAAVVWATPAQFELLTWSELSYRLGRLEGVRFEPDDPMPDLAGLLAFASRFGTFCPDGEPVALAAIPAQGRTAPAMTQEELLGAAAGLGLGAQATAEDLVLAVFSDFAAFAASASPAIIACGRPLSSEHWMEY